jgi:hypothetical protein
VIEKYRHIGNIKAKLFDLVQHTVNFQWYSCAEHRRDIFKTLTLSSLTLIIKKYCDDIRSNNNNRHICKSKLQILG